MGENPCVGDHMAHLISRAVGSGVRRSSAPIRRMASGHGMSSEEELSLMKLYPGYRLSFFGSPGDSTNMTGAQAKKKWVIVEAYPLFAAIGLGVGVCTLHCLRHLFFSPEVFISKSTRG